MAANPFTPQQRAELRNAIARSRIAAENEMRRLREQTARAARSRIANREPAQPIQLTQYLPATHRRQAPRCVYCGAWPIPGAAICPTHTGLLNARA